MNIFASLDPSVKKLLGWKLGDEEEKWALKAVESLVKKLRKRRGAHLHHASGVSAAGGSGTVEDLEYALAHPGSHSKCVTIPRSLDGRLQVSHRKGLPHVIYCRVWRWPNLQSHHELRPTSDCMYPYDSRSEYICINPYHYQRVESATPMTPVIGAVPVNLLRNGSGGGVNGIYYSQMTKSLQDSQQQQRQSSKITNNTLMGIPPCSSSTSFYTTPYSVSTYGLQQSNGSPINNNCYQDQQQLFIQQQQQQHQQHQLRASPLNGSGTFMNGQMCVAPRSASSSACSGGSSASSSISAQSPSALSDDDDFTTVQNAAASIGASVFGSYDLYGINTAASLTSGTIPASFPDYWCSICYYELNSRVGEPFKISSNKVTVDGFTDPSNDEDRICLGLLSNVNRNNTIECTRRHIGRGIRLTCTDSNVTVLNSSASPVFVQSRNSNFKYNLQSTAVCRVPSNASIVIFDFPLFLNMLEKAKQEGYHNVYDLQKMCFIRMSFVKGWGVDYHRQDVTSTPCWIEIQLHRPLAWIDTVLTPMNPPDHLDITSVS